jgi:hypothetical protein
MKIKKDEELEENKSPHVIKQGWPLTILSAKGKKIKAIVRNVKCESNGNWQMDIHRESDDVFIMTMRW